MIPQLLGQFPKLLKTYGEDPDTPTLSSVLAGPRIVEFLEAMQLEIKELEQH
jgi:hypothetical protein